MSLAELTQSGEQETEVEISRACMAPSQIQIEESEIVGRLRELVNAQKKKIENARLLQLEYKRRRTDDVHLWVKNYMLKLVSGLDESTLKQMADHFALSSNLPRVVKNIECTDFLKVIDILGEDAKTCCVTWTDLKSYLNNHNLIVIIDDIHSDFYGCGLSFTYKDTGRSHPFAGSSLYGVYHKYTPQWTFSVKLSMGEHPYILESEVSEYDANKDPVERAKKAEIEKIKKAREEEVREEAVREEANQLNSKNCCTIC
jgi:hypothetical protein